MTFEVSKNEIVQLYETEYDDVTIHFTDKYGDNKEFEYSYKMYLLESNDIDLEQYEVLAEYISVFMSTGQHSKEIKFTISYDGKVSYTVQEEFYQDCKEDLDKIHRMFLKWYEPIKRKKEAKSRKIKEIKKKLNADTDREMIFF